MENTGYIKDLDCTKDTPVIYGHEDAPIYGQGIRIKPRVPGRQDSEHMKKIYLEELLPLEEYDMIAVLLSGGKDSIACYYKLIELGVPKEKIELWHHDIDGGHPSRRMVKENGAIALFSAQPFTTELIGSNKAMYRYEWIWRKTQPSGFMNAKKMPLRAHENIEIFYRKPPTYNPQMTHGHQRKTATAYGTRESDGSSCYGREERNYTYDSTDRYPVDVLQYSTGDKAKRLHPTQKPVDLLEYLVKTYTNPGETVLDNCMGAGSTGVACLNTGREFVGIELDLEYYQIAKERIEQYEI